ncbi:urease subunit beta [Blochmannia endosymbiont of Polyrhachis (Hedomyrma) turneri]|uniref:urease subunit beta n=1 Tax=Blochmannia endosymbiont of Polyrhachis (Hedomyrma) turneri TaxID=1505596 RepID=UPI00061A7CEF|nr:urease subunit beta [Blochmannia endosymbiont of Polyrhachis (Hedomyrma) turneri]AKC60083.1 urease subunit beta [Blochmannia endosymbiont of Polyrhachis (Hedomyrma) turneri]
MIPGEYRLISGDVELNTHRYCVVLCVFNSADRPIQVGSHFHFYEVNKALKFNRCSVWGYRLDIPSGTTIRFEPGQSRTVQLVNYLGKRTVYGFNKMVMGKLDNFI